MSERRTILGIVHHSFFGDLFRPPAEEFYESLEAVKQNGRFRAIEIGYAGDLSASELDRLRSALQHFQVIVVNGGGVLSGGGFSLCHTDQGRLEESVEMAKQVIDFSCRIDAEACLFPSGDDPGEAGRRMAYHSLIQSLSDICAHAERRSGGKLVVTVEQMDRSFHHRQLLGPIRETVAALEAVRAGCDNIGLTFDIAHSPQLGEDPVEALTLAADVVYQVHLGNAVVDDRENPFYGDRHPPFGVDGSVFGESELGEFLSHVRDRRLLPASAVMALEVRTPDGEDPYETLERTREVFLSAWGRE
ncbi:MAG: sugar phosphate isomerase/epimerase [Bacillota bacterium]